MRNNKNLLVWRTITVGLNSEQIDEKMSFADGEVDELRNGPRGFGACHKPYRLSQLGLQ